MSRTQRKYDHEYKVQAVKLAREIGGAKGDQRIRYSRRNHPYMAESS